VLMVPAPCPPRPGAVVSRGGLRYGTATGRLIRPITGVYVATDLRSPWWNAYYTHPQADGVWQTLTAAAAVLPAGAVLADETAAHVWCGWWPQERTPSVIVPPGTALRRRRGLQCRTSSLRTGEVAHELRLPVTSPQRTALDLARRLSRPWALAAVDALLYARLVRPDQLREGLIALRGSRGVRQAAEVVARADAGAASPGESLTRFYLLDAGLGPLQTQVPLLGETYVGDLLVRGKLLVEFEGQRHDEKDQFVADRRRFNALSLLPGMAVVHVTWADLREPALMVAQVRAALRHLGEDV